jgi:predicted nucleic acid-binding protein
MKLVEGIDYLHAFAAKAAEIDGHFLTTREAFRVSTKANLSAYDSVYFELAQRENLPLATLDKALREAAVKAGISTL